MQGIGRESHNFDVCVVGGGMAGVCAAVAAARNGARTALVHDRPVFGGNASSEVRMWICGASGDHNKETGILEEIQLDNLYHNPSLNYSIWDAVLYGKVVFQPNLRAFMNCTCLDAAMDGSRIESICAWQLTTQTHHTIRATQFIDCSGDSILAALTPAEYRTGRESRHEFDEDIGPLVADDNTMGNSLLIQLRRTNEPQPYIAPSWAYRFDGPDDLPNRIDGVSAHNFWWLEIGGLKDTIGDAEAIRDDLMRIACGAWDYIKNRAPERKRAENWALEWMGALPGKRESRRFVGDHILTQNDVRSGGGFDDIIAYGGWPMDDHHPAGILYPGQPTIFHPAPSPYGIPYRCLYSRNVPNLSFAGRNISTTHAALSSTRVMGTCSLLGQAAGTAAALCVENHCDPRAISSGELLQKLQHTLMDDDCWLPGLARQVSALAQSSEICTEGCGADRLCDGHERDRTDESHAWVGKAGNAIEYRWPSPVDIRGIRLVFDSNLNNDKRMPCVYPQSGSRLAVPGSLIRRFRLEVPDSRGGWRTLYREDDNIRRLVSFPVQEATQILRLTPESTWGDEEMRVYSFEPLDTFAEKYPRAMDRISFEQVRRQIAPADLAPPDSGLEVRPAPRQSA